MRYFYAKNKEELYMDINQANREVCDLHIMDYVTKKPWMDADFANTTTAGFSSDPVYAMKKGAKCIKFDNPLDGTISLTFQVHPFRIYSLFSDGEVETTAIIPARKTVECTVAGELSIEDTLVSGTLFVYALNEVGGTNIEGAYASNVFTATTATDLAVGTSYSVCYLVSKTSGSGTTVQKIAFNNTKTPNNYYITMETIDKNENGDKIPVYLTAYKACPQRSMDLSFSSDGDPAEVTITFDCLEDADGNVLDIVEITEE